MMVETSTEADTRIAAAEAEALLQDLVRIPSLSGAESEASDFLKDWMAGHGFQAQVDESGSAVGQRGTGQIEIVLLGHIDTFPGEVPVRIEGRRLFGRGSVDAKGALAAFALAAASITPLPGVKLVVIGATEEEAASSRGARHARDRYHPYACVIGEPSGWDRLTLGYKGRLNVAWSWSGALAHSAGPTRSPAEVAVDTWRSIEDCGRCDGSVRAGGQPTTPARPQPAGTGGIAASTDSARGDGLLGARRGIPSIEQQPAHASHAIRHPRQRRPAASRPQDGDIRHECRRSDLEVPDRGLRAGGFTPGSHPRRTREPG